MSLSHLASDREVPIFSSESVSFHVQCDFDLLDLEWMGSGISKTSFALRVLLASTVSLSMS